MIKFLCNKDCEKFPDTEKGNEYYGFFDEEGDIWLIDDWWIEQGVNKKNFIKYREGTYVKRKNKKYFEVIEW